MNKKQTTAVTNHTSITITILALNRICSIWYQTETGTRLHDTCTRNWHQFSGTSFWSVCHRH